MAVFLPERLRTLGHEVASLLKERGHTVAVAETASGGLISAALLSYPGASKVYKGGLTIYTLESRMAFAGWTQSDVDDYNGPSPSVVSKLAENVRSTLGATYCICESGTAGPNAPVRGTSKSKIPGYVALAVASATGQTKARESGTELGGDREQNMVAFAVLALELLAEVVRESQ